MLETDLYEAIRKVAETRRLFYQRFEDSLQSGIPDIYLGSGMSEVLRPTWIEAKITASPNWIPDFEKGQLAWAARAVQRGERCRTLIASPGGGATTYRVLCTDAIARSAAFGDRWPDSEYQGTTLEDAVLCAMGCRKTADSSLVIQGLEGVHEAAGWPYG